MQTPIFFKPFVALHSLLLLLLSLAPSLRAQPIENPGPDDFVMMDKGAELDKKSLMKSFAYPDSARKAGIQGTVDVHVMIGKSGKAEEYIIRTAVHPLLDSAAARAVMNASFKPAVYEGKAIKSWMTIPIIFRIGKAKAPEPADDAEDTDGYTRPKYDREAFRKEIRNSSNAACALRISVLVGSDGKAKEIKEDNSQCPAELINDVKRVLSNTLFTPATRDGKPSDDWLIITLNFTAK